MIPYSYQPHLNDIYYPLHIIHNNICNNIDITNNNNNMNDNHINSNDNNIISNDVYKDCTDNDTTK